jgi:hypothetical protein
MAAILPCMPPYGIADIGWGASCFWKAMETRPKFLSLRMHGRGENGTVRYC